MKYNLEGRVFTTHSNTSNGEVGEDTRFYYHQKGDIVWAKYSGGEVRKGHLIAKVLDNGQLDMRYHHINDKGELMLGKCISTPSVTQDKRILFDEEWQWLSGDMSSGHSQIIEIKE
ncbi:MAG: n-acetylglutamate synthase [Campylobacterota bacterium]|nr:n-acetylglutamate synthase [Campylobacterota bacterium]